MNHALSLVYILNLQFSREQRGFSVRRVSQGGGVGIWGVYKDIIFLFWCVSLEGSKTRNSCSHMVGDVKPHSFTKLKLLVHKIDFPNCGISSFSRVFTG